LALDGLRVAVERIGARVWLDMISSEYGLVMAELRLDAEARKARRET